MHCRQHLGMKSHTLLGWVVLAKGEMKKTLQITDGHHNSQVLLFILTQFVMYLCTGHDGPETSSPESLVEFSRLCLLHKLLLRNCMFCVKLSVLFQLHKGQCRGGGVTPVFSTTIAPIPCHQGVPYAIPGPMIPLQRPHLFSHVLCCRCETFQRAHQQGGTRENV